MGVEEGGLIGEGRKEDEFIQPDPEEMPNKALRLIYSPILPNAQPNIPNPKNP